MKRSFLNAGTLAIVLAILGLSLSVATAAIGTRGEPVRPVTYFGEQFAAQQQALQSRPAQEPVATF
jgi:hypothetical protein